MASGAMKQAHKTADTFLSPASVLDPVIEATQSKLARAAAVEVPAGWTLLPGGVEREIGVNRNALYGFEGENMWLVTPGGHVDGHAECRILGPCEGRVEEKKGGCGPRNSARIVTTAPVLVKNR